MRIGGNIIWTSANTPLGIGGAEDGAQPSKPTCNATLLRRRNRINTLQPELTNTAEGNSHPRTGGNVFTVAAREIPEFPGGDIAQPPFAPAGNLHNGIARDFQGNHRGTTTIPGAYGAIRE